MQRRIALTLSGAALLLPGCTGLSTGAYQASGYGKEAYDAPIYDEGGLYEPGLYDGGIDRNRRAPWPGGDGRIDDRDL